MAYSFYRIGIRGLVPLVMHNGQTADPLNPFAKALKAVSGKRKKTDADFAEMANIEWRAGLYVNEAGEIILPGRILEAVIHSGAKRSKAGKEALAGLFVETDAVLSFAGHCPVDEMAASPDFRLTVGVRVGQARVMRTRPLLKEWSVEFEVSVDDQVITDAAALSRWVEDAGAYVGVGDWRPRYGRFALGAVEKLAR